MHRKIISISFSLIDHRKFIKLNHHQSFVKNIYTYSSIKKDKENQDKNTKQQIQMKQYHQNRYNKNENTKETDANKLPFNYKKLQTAQ
jgi:hypothetical protein